MINRLIRALVVLVATAAFGLAAQAQQPQSQSRFAFVIGNDSYEGAELPTAGNDAALVAEMLKSAGFDLTGARNLDQETLRASYREFLEKVAAAGPGAVAFVYMSGYGVQLEGENFFIPPGAQITRPADIQLNGVRLSDITRTLGGMPAQGRIMVFDLAYEGPFAMATAPGLAAMRAGDGDLIAFNAAPGSAAPVPQPPYGAFAQALAESAREPGAPIADVFEGVRQRVAELTNGAQTPFVDARIQPIVLFAPRPNVARPTARWTPPPPPQYVEDSHYYLPLPAAREETWLAPPEYVEAPPEPVYILPPEEGYGVSPWVAAPVALAAGIAAGSIIYRRDRRARQGFAPGRRFLPPIVAGPRGRQRPLPTALQQQNLQNFQQRPRPVNNQFQGGGIRRPTTPGLGAGQPGVRPGQQGFQPGQQGLRPGQQGFQPTQQPGQRLSPQQLRQQQQMQRQQQLQQQRQQQQQQQIQQQQTRQQQIQQQRNQQQQRQQQLQQQRNQQIQQQRGQQMQIQQQRQQQMQQQQRNQQMQQQQRNQQMQQQQRNQQMQQQQRNQQMQQQRNQQMQQQRQQQMQQQRNQQMQQQRQQQMQQQQRQQQMQRQQQQRRNCVRGTPGCP